MNRTPTPRGRKPKKLTGNISLDLPNRLFATGMIGRLSFCQLKTLLAFLQFADNRTGVAWPAVATVAGMVFTTPRNVRTAIAGLERLGLLTTTVRGGGKGNSQSPSVRRITLPEPGSDPATTPCPPENDPLLDCVATPCPADVPPPEESGGNLCSIPAAKLTQELIH